MFGFKFHVLMVDANTTCKLHMIYKREINCFLENLLESTYWRSPCFSILETQYLILQTRTSRNENQVLRIQLVKTVNSLLRSTV